jgi:uncharacterized protein YcbX
VRIDQIWRYPVKSMIGGTVASVEIGELGLVGDREWAVRDLERGGIRGAKKIAELMLLSARYTGEGNHVAISLPDGTELQSADPQVHERLSAALGHSVRLEALAPSEDLEHYRRGGPDSDDFMAELRGIFGRDVDEPLPDFSIFPPVIMEFESPPGTYYDVFPLMLMTTSAVRAVATALPDSAVDIRRFRPSLVIDAGDAEGHPEFEWVGRTVYVGSAELQIEAACPRCVMVTRAVGNDVPADRAVLRHIVRELDQNLGVYATVTRPGTISVGDTVRLG